jgi:hypothetical protein
MLGLVTDVLLFEQMRPGLILWLHLAFHTVLMVDQFILFVLFIILQLFVKNHILFKLVLVIQEKRVLDNIRETHPLLTINHEYFLKKILEFIHPFLQLVPTSQSSVQTKGRISASPLDFSLHIVTCIQPSLPLKGYSAKSIK